MGGGLKQQRRSHSLQDMQPKTNEMSKLSMATATSITTTTEIASASGAHEANEVLQDNVKTLDQLLLDLAEESSRQRRVGGWLSNGMQRLLHASEVALLATLMRRPQPEIRAQLGYINRQLALLAEMALRSGRGAAKLHGDLCRVKDRLQRFSMALA